MDTPDVGYVVEGEPIPVGEAPPVLVEVSAEDLLAVVVRAEGARLDAEGLAARERLRAAAWAALRV